MQRRILIAVMLLVAPSGCAGFGRGVAEVVLAQEGEDTRVCQVRGGEFEGLSDSLDSTANEPGATTKMLMIHGIGEHLPGYSTRLRENLADALGLTVAETRFKELAVFQPDVTGGSAASGEPIGNLRVHRLLNEDLSREFLFYELTWSKIAEPEREILAFDQSGENEFRRAAINNALKGFLNTKIPDPMIYLGDRREAILVAAAQSICWMGAGDWDDLPDSAQGACNPGDRRFASELARDDFFFVTHSMGSRIFVDALQRLVALVNDPAYKARIPEAVDVLRDEQFTVFMLANQLPLLQMGRVEPAVTNRIPEFCGPAGSSREQRFLERTSIVAFSDPNDILSYTIPPEFVDNYLDSRICPAITNVNINVAFVANFFGLGDFADPLAAHVDYDDDERVIAMIAEGFGPGRTAPLVQERCSFTRTINQFGR